jgi:hypothetical protein
MTKLVTSITAAPAPETGNNATASIVLGFDFDLLGPAELVTVLSRYGPKDVGCSQTSFNAVKANVLSARTPQSFCVN